MLIDDIKINTRYRKDFEDIQNLADSIREIGLIHPIVIDQGRNLICGERRLKALRLLDIHDLVENKHFRVVNTVKINV